jgi:hypothetical protein
MRTSALLATLLVAGMIAPGASGCASGGSPPDGPSPPTTSPAVSNTSASPPTTEPSVAPSPTDSTPAPTSTPTRTKSATEKLLLPQQVQLQEGGDGLGPSCSSEGAYPPGFDHDPGVWLNNLYSPTEYPYIVVLCLRGFQEATPIEVRLTTGSYTATTQVTPTSDPPTLSDSLGYEDEPSTTLFDDGAELRIYARDYGGGAVDGPEGAFVTEMWSFFPPRAARDAMADAGSIELTAVQGALTARIEQPISMPTRRDYYMLTRGRERLVLVGYPEGAVVPIGLYKKKSGASSASLVEELGTVTMPRSRVDSFAVPPGLLTGRRLGTYCVLPPVDQEGDCERVDNWPDFPGQISPGDRGARVSAWQEILIGAGVITDRPENRDGVYGPATQAAVGSFLQDHGWTNPDGDGILGRQFYNLISG